MKTGRPTKYVPGYCDQIIKFFNVKPSKQVMKAKIKGFGKAGNQNFDKEEFQHIPNPLPTFGAFARSIGVHEDTVVEWSKKHEDFSAAYNAAKGLQKDFLIQNGLAGLYPPAFAIFTAKNITDMRDRQEFSLPPGEALPMTLNVTSKTADDLLRILTAASSNSARSRKRPAKASRST